jgi:hypothetical protein
MMRKAIPALIGGLPAEGFAGGAPRGCRLSAAHTNTGGARSNNAAELRRRSYEAVTDAQSFDTTLRSFNARAGLFTEL